MLVRLNMFRTPLCPSSVAHDDSVGYHIGHLVLELLLDGILVVLQPSILPALNFHPAAI